MEVLNKQKMLYMCNCEQGRVARGCGERTTEGQAGVCQWMYTGSSNPHVPTPCVAPVAVFLTESGEVAACHQWLSSKGESDLPAPVSLLWFSGKVASCCHSSLSSSSAKLALDSLSFNDGSLPFSAPQPPQQRSHCQTGFGSHCQNEVREPRSLLPPCQQRKRNSHGQEPKIEADKIGQETALARHCSPLFYSFPIISQSSAEVQFTRQRW